MREQDVLRQCVMLRVKLNALRCLAYGCVVALPLLLAALRNDEQPYDMLLPLIPLGSDCVV